MNNNSCPEQTPSSTPALSRRSVIAASVGGITLLAGCQEAITGDGVELTADQARVTQATIDESMYEKQDMESYEINEEFSLGGETRSVEASSWVATYTISVTGIEDFHDDPDATQETIDEIGNSDIAAFSVLSTPSEKIAGQEVNPVSYFSDAELIDEASGRVDEGRLEDIEPNNEYTVRMLGEETTVTVLSATAAADSSSDTGDESEAEGEEDYDVLVHLAEVSHEDDIIVVFGLHHADLDEQPQFEAFIENIEHPV